MTSQRYQLTTCPTQNIKQHTHNNNPDPMSSTTTETTATIMTTQDAPTPQEGSILLCKFFRGVRLNKWISCHRVGNSVIFVLIALWLGCMELQNGILLYLTKVRVTYATNVLSLFVSDTQWKKFASTSPS